MGEILLQFDNFVKAFNAVIYIFGRNDPFGQLDEPLIGRFTNSKVVGARGGDRALRFDWDETSGSHINIARGGIRYKITWGHTGSDDYSDIIQEINTRYSGNIIGLLNAYRAAYFSESVHEEIRVQIRAELN